MTYLVHDISLLPKFCGIICKGKDIHISVTLKCIKLKNHQKSAKSEVSISWLGRWFLNM